MRTSAPVWVAAGFALAATGQPAVTVTNAAVSSGTRAVFQGVTPTRVFDTHGAQAPALAGGATRNVQITGTAGVPSDATAVVVSASARKPAVTGYLTVWPAGSARPNVASLNFGPGPTVTNLVTATLGTGGQISLYVPTGPVDVQLDVVGYYVHHDHDDRYLTSSQAQARTAPSALTCAASFVLQAVAADGTPTCVARDAADPVSPVFGSGTTDITVTANASANLTADTYANDLTLGSGSSLRTNGYRLFVNGTLTMGDGSRIHYNGNPGTRSGAGAALQTVTAGGAPAGACNGGGATTTNSLGGAAHNGSAGLVTVTRPLSAAGGTSVFRTLAQALTGRSLEGEVVMGGASGGGGACDGQLTSAGGGGGGGGVVIVAAYRIVVVSGKATIAAVGGDSAGAGGGGGGVLVLASQEPLPAGLLTSVTGGTGGASPWGSGLAGTSYVFDL